MALIRTDDKHYKAIANAIREKNGETTKYKPEEIADAILAMVAEIPPEYIIPSGNKDIVENGTHDVASYATVTVNVPNEPPKESGEYHITVDFRDYEGYAMPMTGYYYVNGGSEHYFYTSQLDLWSVANADSQVKIAVINAGSPDVSGSNCSVSWTTDVVMIDDIEYYACFITISNFNGDAFVTYRET